MFHILDSNQYQFFVFHYIGAILVVCAMLLVADRLASIRVLVRNNFLGGVWHTPLSGFDKHTWLISVWNGMFPENKVHGANMGPIWSRQDSGGPRVGPMNFAIWVVFHFIVHNSISNNQYTAHWLKFYASITKCLCMFEIRRRTLDGANFIGRWHCMLDLAVIVWCLNMSYKWKLTKFFQNEMCVFVLAICSIQTWNVQNNWKYCQTTIPL